MERVAAATALPSYTHITHISNKNNNKNLNKGAYGWAARGSSRNRTIWVSEAPIRKNASQSLTLQRRLSSSRSTVCCGLDE